MRVVVIDGRGLWGGGGVDSRGRGANRFDVSLRDDGRVGIGWFKGVGEPHVDIHRFLLDLRDELVGLRERDVVNRYGSGFRLLDGLLGFACDIFDDAIVGAPSEPALQIDRNWCCLYDLRVGPCVPVRLTAPSETIRNALESTLDHSNIPLSQQTECRRIPAHLSAFPHAGSSSTNRRRLTASEE